MTYKKKKEQPIKKYQRQSQTVRDSILPRKGNVRAPTVCRCGNVDYKSMAFVIRRSMRVIDNLAKNICAVEERSKQQEESLTGFLKNAQEFNNELIEEIKKLKQKMEVYKHVN